MRGSSAGRPWSARRRLTGRRDSRMAGPRIQPPRSLAPPGCRAEDRRGRLAGGSDSTLPGVGPYTAAAVRNFALRRGRAAARRQRRARRTTNGRLVSPVSRTGADGSRGDRLPGAHPAVRAGARLQRPLPLGGDARRTGSQAVSLRRLVPPASSRSTSRLSPSSLDRLQSSISRRSRARTRRARRRRGRYRNAPELETAPSRAGR